MGFAKRPTDDPMQDALQRELGGARPGVSTTMPIGGLPVRQMPSAGSQRLEGFDLARPQDRKKSAKDAFAHYSQLAPTAPTNDKAALGQWFEQYIRPGFEGEGHKVSAVDGDKFTYGNHEGTFTVDFGRGAGAEGGALAWQADPADDATRARYGTPQGQGTQGLTAPVLPGPSDLMAQILAALQAQQEPDPQALLLEQLR